MFNLRQDLSTQLNTGLKMIVGIPFDFSHEEWSCKVCKSGVILVYFLVLIPKQIYQLFPVEICENNTHIHRECLSLIFDIDFQFWALWAAQGSK